MAFYAVRRNFRGCKNPIFSEMQSEIPRLIYVCLSNAEIFSLSRYALVAVVYGVLLIVLFSIALICAQIIFVRDFVFASNFRFAFNKWCAQGEADSFA